MSETLPIDQIKPYLQGILNASKSYLEQLRKDRCTSITYQNKHGLITQKMQETQSYVSKLNIKSQDIMYIHSELIKDAVAVFDKSFTQFKIHELSRQIKQKRQQLRRLHNMKMPLINNLSTGIIKPYIVNISKYTYIPKFSITIPDKLPRELTEEPVSYGKYLINQCNSQKKISKILTIASTNDIEVFEFIRKNTAEMLRLDIIWDERKCMLKKQLEKLNSKRNSIKNLIQIHTTKYINLKYQLESIPIPKHSSFDPMYIQQIRKKCEKLEYGLKIVDDYKKIEEFVIWVSEYGRQNPTDLDILDGVQYVITQSNEQLQILHNQLIGVRNYCEIKNVGIF